MKVELLDFKVTLECDECGTDVSPPYSYIWCYTCYDEHIPKHWIKELIDKTAERKLWEDEHYIAPDLSEERQAGFRAGLKHGLWLMSQEIEDLLLEHTQEYEKEQ